MEYIMFIWFLMFPAFAIGIYLITYRVEVKEEIQEIKNKYEMNQLETSLKLEAYKVKLENVNKEQKYYHDLKKHLEVINCLYEQGEMERAKAYGNELLDAFPETECIISNSILNVLFFDLKKKCEEKEIKLTTKINHRLTFEEINDKDLVTIFSNLARNAIEAAEESDRKEIIVEINQTHNFIVSIFKNTFSNELIYERDKLFSTKTGHKGYGVENIIETVEQYNGTYLIETEEEMFKFQVVLPL